MSVVVGRLKEVDYPCEPALFQYCLISFGTASLARYAWIASRLLHAFLDEDPQDFEHAFQVLRGGDFSLIAEYAAGDFAGYCSSGGICLGVKKRDEVREGESGKERDVGFYWRQEKSKYIGLGCGGVQVCAVGVISDFFVGVCKNLIDIFYNRIVSMIES